MNGALANAAASLPVTNAAVAAPEPPLSPEEKLHIELWNGLVHCIVSNRDLWATVDVAVAKVRMAAAIAATPAHPLELAPLWNYMREVHTPEVAATETLLFFASRASRWGIEMTLPAPIAALPPTERDAHVERMKDRGGSSGTFVGVAPLPQRKAASARRAKDFDLTKPAGRIRLGSRVGFIVMAALFLAEHFWGGDIEANYAAALGDICRQVEQQGEAIRCVASTAAFAAPERTAVRAEIVELALGVKVVFVDRDDNVVDPAQPVERFASNQVGPMSLR